MFAKINNFLKKFPIITYSFKYFFPFSCKKAPTKIKFFPTLIFRGCPKPNSILKLKSLLRNLKSTLWT